MEKEKVGKLIELVNVRKKFEEFEIVRWAYIEDLLLTKED